jgi:L-serine dehydratase
VINEKISLRTWIEAAADQGVPLHTYLLKLSSEELELSEDAILEQMQTMLQVMEESAAFGLTGVSSHSGLTGGAAKKLQEARQSENYKNILGGVVNDAVAYAMAVGECNAAMGRIVAAPTAGASGVLPGVLLALKQHYNLNERQMAEALVVAGNIGMVIASRASLSGAMGGCQAECGSGAAMAAGAAVDVLGGTPEQVGHAVAIVFKNMLGLVCDPVAGLVEVPCVKRNVIGAVNAITSCDMAMAGIESAIPVDEVIDAMKAVGDTMPCSLRETGEGGLAATPTGKKYAESLPKL